MTRDETRWCLGFSAILMVVTSVPYVVGFAAQGQAWVFTGFVFGVEDGNSYIAKMLQGATGAWLFSTPYSSRTSPGIVAFLPYLILGKLAAGQEIHLQLVLLFHSARLVLIPLAVLATYRFAAAFLDEPSFRRRATVLATAGGGLGWLLALLGRVPFLGSQPIDFYSPEGFGFLAFYGLPHLILARSLLLFALTDVLRSGQDRRLAARAGALLLVLGLVQPLAVLSGYAGIAAHVLASLAGRTRRDAARLRERLLSAAIAVGISLPIVAYYALGSLLLPQLRQWTAQNVLPSPHPLHYLLGYAIVLVPAYLGARAFRRDASPGRLLPVWVALLLLAAYLPVTVQRRLVDGAWVALSVLAARGLADLGVVGLRRAAVPAVLLLSLLTSSLLVLGGTWQASRPSPPLHRPVGEVRAFEWLAEHAAAGSVVLAMFDIGNALPAWAPMRVVIGHGPETVNLAELRPQVEAFFSGDLSSAEALAFLAAEEVDFVFEAPGERDAVASLGRPVPAAFDSGGYVVVDVSAAR